MIVRNIINRIAKIGITERMFLATDNGFSNFSIPLTLTADVANRVLLQPGPENCLRIKGITITGEGNSGEVIVKRTIGNPENLVVLPVYFSVQNRGTTTGSLNICLEPGEPLLLDVIGRGNNRTFVGISYIELTNEGNLE